MLEKIVFILEFAAKGKRVEDGTMTVEELREWAYNAAIKAGYTPEEAQECLADLKR